MTPPPIDRTHLPTDPAVLQQLVLGLLDERDAQARQVQRLQHWLRNPVIRDVAMLSTLW
jgi:hypothetical protein